MFLLSYLTCEMMNFQVRPITVDLIGSSSGMA